MTELESPNGWPPIDPADGWAGILTELRCDLLTIDPGHTVRQIKQKFGELSVWAEASDAALADAVRERITTAEVQSARTCERCGRPGRIQQKPNGWLQALCDAHAAEAAKEEWEEG